jgi:hypothetical protein
MAAQFHFPKNAFALHLLFERAQGLVDIVVANDDLHGGRAPFHNRFKRLSSDRARLAATIATPINRMSRGL